MAGRGSGPRGIKDLFYETRVLLGRDYTLRRFAEEQLGGSVDPVMLGYIETGRRFPAEALVRRLAVVRRQDAHELLAILWRDRMLHAFGKELRRALNAPRAVAGVEDAELAVLVSQAIAALPDDGSWISAQTWRRAFAKSPRRRKGTPPASGTAVKQIESILVKQDLVELRGGKVRRRGRHFVARDAEQRQALALEFCALFAKGLLDKLALGENETGTYLRNHFLHIEPERLPEFQRRLDRELRKLTEEFAADASPRAELLNVLVTSTKL
jgi:hypothetical protein